MNKYNLSIIAAGTIWGFMGMFTRKLAGFGFSTADTLIVRCGFAAVLFGITILIQDPSQFKIRVKDIWCFLGLGICSLLFFTYCYFQCIRLTSLSMAAVLLYTAPSIVMVFSLFLFKEKLNKSKVLALLLAFAGCCFVSGIGNGNVNLSGFLLGLGAGLGYALYSIFARLALNRGYNNKTINFYAMFIATLGAGVLWGYNNTVTLISTSPSSLLWSIATALFSCYIPYFLYSYGLSGTETGKAAVMASTEPVVATLVGLIIYKETLSFLSLAGVILVIAAIFILNKKPKYHPNKQ